MNVYIIWTKDRHRTTITKHITSNKNKTHIYKHETTYNTKHDIKQKQSDTEHRLPPPRFNTELNTTHTCIHTTKHITQTPIQSNTCKQYRPNNTRNTKIRITKS